MESLQVRKYHQTIVGATLREETEQLIIFMEELIKRQRGDKKAEDAAAFSELSDQDQERVNGLLSKAGISYNTGFN